jgi:hypothetical protein
MKQKGQKKTEKIMEATYNGIPANHIAYSQELTIKAGKKSLSAIAWNYMKRCGTDMIDIVLNYDTKYNKAAKFGCCRRKAYWATYSRIAKAVWAWARDMRKVAVTTAAMVAADKKVNAMTEWDAQWSTKTAQEKFDYALKQCVYGLPGMKSLLIAEKKENLPSDATQIDATESLWKRYLQAKARWFAGDDNYTFATYCNYRISKLA